MEAQHDKETIFIIGDRSMICKRGHELTGDNTHIENSGSRRCIKCKKLDDDIYYKTKIKMKSKVWRHGDVDGIPIQSIPSDAKPSENNKTVMYGEQSGHHHTFNGQVLVYEPTKPDFIEVDGEQRQVQKYVQVLGKAELTHQEHATIEITEGMYAILQELEFDPLEQQIRRVQD